jgi:NAD-dependent dihydropyrimidine dehydrogenase PreA subunit/DNA-binding MarR family transcriptional regulator
MNDQTYYQQLAETVGAGESEFISKIFEELIDENEAKVLLAAAPPATTEEIAEKGGIEAGDIEAMIDALFNKGLLFKSKKPEGTKYYRVRTVPQMHDATALYSEVSKKTLDLWKKYMATEWPAYMKTIESVLPQPVMRIIPVNAKIDAQSQVLAFDDVKDSIESARSLAVTKCSCRVIDGACGKDLEVCIQFDKAADYALERGTGRKLEKDEAIEMLKRCEEEGLVHVGDNRRTVGHVICNCCSDCCMNWPSVRGGLGKFVLPSRFQALADSELCSSCETCLERCYFDAIRMEGENDTVVVDSEKCMGCGLCLVTCPDEALSLKEVRPEDFVPI